MKHTAENTPGLAWKALDRNPAYDGPDGIFTDFEGCDSGIDTTPTGETIDITPEGCKTPEGNARVNEAMKAFTESREEVARLATSLLRNGTVLDILRAGLEAQDEHEAIDQLDALYDAVAARLKAEEAFLRAVVGR